ncbi:unnamed protein product [Phytophthora fragariaefolia]|uniref:Unnamed protein product n=1 Tax=Phytophthora fragariaefolia TaxID=1490495 RepID=A0A9W6U011_9STRA|nr:unnamed protein product [Phytophthora fragariaefolia]
MWCVNDAKKRRADAVGNGSDAKAKHYKASAPADGPWARLRLGSVMRHPLIIDAATMQVDTMSRFALAAPGSPARQASCSIMFLSSQESQTSSSDPSILAVWSQDSSQPESLAETLPSEYPVHPTSLASPVLKTPRLGTSAPATEIVVADVESADSPNSKGGASPPLREVWVSESWPVEVKRIEEHSNPHHWKFSPVSIGIRNGAGCGGEDRCNAATCANAKENCLCMETNCSFSCCSGNGFKEHPLHVIARSFVTSIRGLVAKDDIAAGEVLGEYFGHLDLFGPPCRNGPVNDGFRTHLKTLWTGTSCRSPLAGAQARALHALSADTPPPAASPETSVSVMAIPADSPGADGGLPSRPPLAGVAEVSAPSPLSTASTGDASGEGSESSVAQPDDVLSPVLGAVPRSAADAPEAASSAGSADSQPQGSVTGSGAPGDGACSAADAREASSAVPGAPRFSSVRWEDIEDIVTTGTDRTVRQVQESAQRHFLALARLVVDLNRRPPLRTDYELDQRLKAAGSLSDVVDALAPIPRSLGSSQAAAVLEQRCRRLDKSLADTHKVIRQDREQFKAGIASFAAQLRQLRGYLEQSDRQSSVSGGTSSSIAFAMPAAFTTILEELGALQLPIPPPPAASGSSEGSGSTPPASSGSLGGAAATSGSSTSPTVDSDTSDDSGPVIPCSLHKGKGKMPAKSSAKRRSAPPPPKKKQRLGRPSADLKARKAAKQAASAAVSSSGPFTERSFIAPGRLSFDFVGAGLWHCASSTASTASLPSTPVVSRGITPGTEASVPVEIDDDGGSGADGAASEASVASGGVFSSPVVSQPRRDGRPTRAASTTAGLRSIAAAENESAPCALVLGLATPSRTPGATQASVASSASAPDPAESVAVVAAASAAVVTPALARRRVANAHTGPVPPARVVVTPTPRQASAPCARAVVTATLSTMSGTRSTAFERVTAIPAPIQGPQPRVRASRKLPYLANPLLEPAFTAPGAQEARCEILNARIPIASDRVTECSQVSDRIGSDTPEYLETGSAWSAYNKGRNLRADRVRLQIPKRFWVWCTPDAGGKINCPPEILLEFSMLQYSFETLTWAPSTAAWTVEVVDRDARQPWRDGWVWVPAEHPFNTTFAPCYPSFPLFIPEGSAREEVGPAIVINPALRQSHVTDPWAQEAADARAHAAADTSAAADSPSDTSSARTPIPAAN